MSADQPQFFLDVPTLTFVAVCLAGLLGLFLIVAWLQQRDARALAWWGSAYLIGAASMLLSGMQGSFIPIPPEVPGALFFLACGVIWNGVRLFQGRKVLVLAASAGAAAWLVIYQFPALAAAGGERIGLGALIVSAYTFVIAWELWRERRKSLFSRTAAVIVPGLHAAIFLLPLAMQMLWPDSYATGWMTVFALETIIYAVGTAFIVLLMVKDHHVNVYRSAASTDHLTGLLNRRAFLEGAKALCEKHGARGPVTLMMFDLDHFKSINDRFGHAVGDEALRVFAQVASSSMRASDVVGRLGGEEFAAIVPGGADVAKIVAER
jgi:GGDEF domain-containing protein